MTSSTNRTSTATDDGEERRPPLDLSVTKIAGGALAAVTTAFAASFLGVNGTITGAAFGSVLSSVAATVYATSLKTAGARIRTTRTLVPSNASDPQDPAGVPPDLTGRSVSLPGETTVLPSGPPDGAGHGSGHESFGTIDGSPYTGSGQRPTYGASQSSPYGRAGQDPHGAGQPPYGAGQPHYGAGQPQYGAGQSPYGNGQAPYGSGQGPYGAGQGPYGAGQSPYGAGQGAHGTGQGLGYGAGQGPVHPPGYGSGWPEPAPQAAYRPEPARRAWAWKPIALLAGLVFVVAMGSISATELFLGHPISDSKDTGTSIGTAARGGPPATEKSEDPEKSESPSPSATTTSGSPSSSDEASESPSPTTSDSASPGETTDQPAPDASPEQTQGGQDQGNQDQGGQGDRSPAEPTAPASSPAAGDQGAVVVP